ncbi:hypothetical protein [Peptoniphilus sp.]|uniref:hypothetical protein n=1 Tax=Peptoniphilus sp. TaxID=1971214 RepID=UPI002A7F9886|nr:hypothetical protein [Peptoniphilus sp.]MDY3902444.1 hypothetical protein [Peptoniphilus sp.]
MLGKNIAYDGKNSVLAFADPYVAVTVTLKKGSGKDISERSIVKAGTVYPKNDATAKGIIPFDIDVTDGDMEAPLLIEGYVYKDKLPEAINAEAKLTEIKLV